MSAKVLRSIFIDLFDMFKHSFPLVTFDVMRFSLIKLLHFLDRELFQSSLEGGLSSQERSTCFSYFWQQVKSVGNQSVTLVNAIEKIFGESLFELVSKNDPVKGSQVVCF